MASRRSSAASRFGGSTLWKAAWPQAGYLQSHSDTA
jgi:hypothetical protein